MKITSQLILAPLLLASLVLAICIPAAAQSSQQLPSDAPPKMDNLTEAEPTITSTTKKRASETTHTSQIGEQTEVKVTNKIGTYIVKPNQTVGTSLPGDAQSSSNNAVQWVVKSWGGNKNTDPTAIPPTLENNPENPTSTDSK